MIDLETRLQSCLSSKEQKQAVLVLEDGTYFCGRACGAEGKTLGEICFNTTLEGYLEVITDPSYAGQIVVMTYPQIGNYGVNRSDMQGHPALRGLVVHDMCYKPSNWRSELTLPDYLKDSGIVAIEGIDTRALVKHIREAGALKGVLATGDVCVEDLIKEVRTSESLSGINLVKTLKGALIQHAKDEVKSENFALDDIPLAQQSVIAYDCGAKRSILDGLQRAGCDVSVVPWNTPAEEILNENPDGVFLSNGPGDPNAVEETYEQVKKLIGVVPLFGICLGHQMLCKAAGARMEKLKYGHHGGNHPVKNLLTNRVEITSQNHGFNLDFSSLGPLIPEQSANQSEHFNDLRQWISLGCAPVVNNPHYGRIKLTHVNLNDGTAEGIAFLDVPAFSVQYHPEAHPGPTDSTYLFDAFVRLMDKRTDYLNFNIATSRLNGWRF